MKISLDCSIRIIFSNNIIYIPHWTRIYVSMKYTPVSKWCFAVHKKMGEVFWFRPESTRAISVVIRMLQSRHSRNWSQIKYTLFVPNGKLSAIMILSSAVNVRQYGENKQVISSANNILILFSTLTVQKQYWHHGSFCSSLTYFDVFLNVHVSGKQSRNQKVSPNVVTPRESKLVCAETLATRILIHLTSAYTRRLLLATRGCAINQVLLLFNSLFVDRFRFKQHFNELRVIAQTDHQPTGDTGTCSRVGVNDLYWQCKQVLEMNRWYLCQGGLCED